METIKLITQLLLILISIVVVPIILIILWYLWYMFSEWFKRKYSLFCMAIKLIITGQDKQIKAIGWTTLKVVFWESKD